MGPFNEAKQWKYMTWQTLFVRAVLVHIELLISPLDIHIYLYYLSLKLSILVFLEHLGVIGLRFILLLWCVFLVKLSRSNYSNLNLRTTTECVWVCVVSSYENTIERGWHGRGRGRRERWAWSECLHDYICDRRGKMSFCQRGTRCLGFF